MLKFLYLALAVSFYCSKSYCSDTTIAPASHRYSSGTVFRRLFLGNNYRKLWSQPVKMPVFDATNAMGGLRVIKLGGGSQTRSLHLEDRQGSEWVLRTIDKDVEKVLLPILRKTVIKDIVQDMISAAHPYAPLVVQELGKQTGVITPQAHLFYVPDDPALGRYRHLFAGRICFLMQRTPITRFEPLEANELERKLLNGYQHQVMQDQVLKARILDMVVADWDRHKKQWRWIRNDSANVHYYQPVAVDPDLACFVSDGLLAKVVGFLAMPQLEGFKKGTNDFKDLNHKSWQFDRRFLSSLSAADWKKTIENFQDDLSDEAISNAVRKLPPEIYKINGQRMEAILRARRDGLMSGCMKYYRHLSKHVYIFLSATNDDIEIIPSRDSVSIRIYSRIEGKAKSLVYNRKIFAHETKQITFVSPDERYLLDNGLIKGIDIDIQSVKFSSEMYQDFIK
jgi:hypothetical protein